MSYDRYYKYTGSLIDAICGGREEKVRHLLKDPRTNAMAKDHLGYSTLHCASQNGHVDMINVLLAKAEEEGGGRARLLLINDKHYRKGWTALHYACYFGHVEAVQLLLKKGADATIQGKDGRTAFQVARNSRCFRNVLPAAKNITEKNGNKTQVSNGIEMNASKDEKDALLGMISELKEEQEALKRQLWTEKAAWKKRNELLAARNKEMEHKLDTLEAQNSIRKAQNEYLLNQNNKRLNEIVEQLKLEVSTLQETNAHLVQREHDNLKSKQDATTTLLDPSLADELVTESLRALAAIGNALENQQHNNDDEPMDATIMNDDDGAMDDTTNETDHEHDNMFMEGAVEVTTTSSNQHDANKIKLVMKQVAALKTNLEAYCMKNEKDG